MGNYTALQIIIYNGLMMFFKDNNGIDINLLFINFANYNLDFIETTYKFVNKTTFFKILKYNKIYDNKVSMLITYLYTIIFLLMKF